MKRALLAGFLVTAFSSSAFAETIEVGDVDGLREALASAGAGDVLLLAAGEWELDRPVTVARSGTESEPLSIVGSPGTIVRTSATGAVAFDIQADNVTVRGIQIEAADAGVVAAGENLVFASLVFVGTPAPLVCTGCVAPIVVDTEVSGGAAEVGISLVDATSSIVENNWIHDVDGVGIEVSGGANLVADNVVEGAAGDFAIRVENAGLEPSLVLANSARGAGVQTVGGVTIANNVVWMAGGDGLSVGIGDGTLPIDVLHNTVVDAEGSCLSVSEAPLSSTVLAIANNVFYCEGGSAVIFVDGTSTFLEMVANALLGSADFPGDSVPGGSPGVDFEDAAGGNFYPTAESPFLDAGDPVYGVGDDYNGGGRGQTPDIGAYERLAVENPESAPGGGFKYSEQVPPEPGEPDPGTGDPETGGGGSEGGAGIAYGPTGPGNPRPDEGCQCASTRPSPGGATLALLVLGLLRRGRTRRRR